MKHLFLVVIIAMIMFKCILPIFIAAVARETYSLIKFMQPISKNYNWSQTDKDYSRKFVKKLNLVSITKDEDRSIRVKKYQKKFLNFYHYFPYIC